ncbi:lipopolysaccharide kinase InaA family protein [Salegentibacter sp. Hel_I_6]|uniref:lipopolysaccharide kinase InaA family protein n=1 Tax=Salegentibacter sp. Hel_I_6 TaxID=1250278 RepID=UPI0005642810|nr:lipopolysaccharide kinase InaA family protein [Salegentibacter sp. Hel_I_6]
MKIYISPHYKISKENIENLLSNFKENGQLLFEGSRNEIKVVECEDRDLNIKAFKPPNFVNRYMYVTLRKSKAQRSFEYAHKLLETGVGTPRPVAYAETIKNGALDKSFYISEHLEYELTFRDLDLAKEGHEAILRDFTRFTYYLHENKIEFLDHSPGNTLIKTPKGKAEFYLVDLNRMNFRTLSFEDRMNNFSRLSQDVEIFKVMANEYALKIDKSEEEVLEKMLYYNNRFFEQRSRKRRFKNKLKKIAGFS